MTNSNATGGLVELSFDEIDSVAGGDVSASEVLAVGARGGNDITLSGTIADVTFLGSVIRLRVALGRNVVSLDTFNDQRTAPPARGEPVTISLASKDLLVL